MKLPRTIAIPVIARKYFPSDDKELSAAINKLAPGVLKDVAKQDLSAASSESAARTIQWRGRTVDLEDASISVALSSVSAASEKLAATLKATTASHPRDRAAAYDEILTASQDAVDAAKHAIDELVAEGVPQGDKRIQSLQITRTSLGYGLISWRIGRNRVLAGVHDGALPDSAPLARGRKSKKGKKTAEEGTGRKLARLRERVVLYDQTLQSVESIRELPGVASDEALLGELDAKYNYVRALKCLAIARSHSLLSGNVEALALLHRASGFIARALPSLSASPASAAPPNLHISTEDAKYLSELLFAELTRSRALVEIGKIAPSQPAGQTPWVERLDHYPQSGEVDTSNIVQWPPRMDVAPVKPLFFDVAWNYIAYPGKQPHVESAPVPPVLERVAGSDDGSRPGTGTSEGGTKKKGWFGFGRG
jgi:signal recognition particle subunit SRP68